MNSDEGLNVAVIGASGSIGGEFVQQLARDDKIKSIYAFCRSEKDFAADKVKSCYMDLEDEDSIKKACEEIDEGCALDMAVVASGVLHDGKIMPEKSLKDLSQEKFHRLFAVNTIGPAMVAKYLLPKLNRERRAVFVALSARVGSISDNHLGGWYAYRASKTALNMILKNAAIEMRRVSKDIIIIGLHPGTVDSNLSKPFQSSVKADKLFTSDIAVGKLINVINSVKAEDSGNVFDFNGIKIDF